MYGLRFTKLKTEGQTKENKISAKSYRPDFKILANTGLADLPQSQTEEVWELDKPGSTMLKAFFVETEITWLMNFSQREKGRKVHLHRSGFQEGSRMITPFCSCLLIDLAFEWQ